MGWGGKRHGSGRKPKPKTAARVLEHPSSSVPPTTNGPPVIEEFDGPPVIEEFDAPDSLTKAERDVWLKQAPHAFANGTLTRATALSFERYCRLVVQEHKESESSGVGGANHRGLMKQVNALELQFLLTASGKPIAVPKPQEAPASKLSRFRRSAE